MADQTVAHMSTEFTNLPIGDLIVAPIVGAAQGQKALAQTTLEFINLVGFDKEGKMRMVDFPFLQDVIKGKDDNGHDILGQEMMAMPFPLIGIVPIPSLAITRIEASFDMEVKTSETDSLKIGSEVGVEASAGGGFAGFTASVKLTGSVSVDKERTRKEDQRAKYHISLIAEQAKNEGLARALDLVQNLNTAKRLKKETDTDTDTDTERVINPPAPQPEVN